MKRLGAALSLFVAATLLAPAAAYKFGGQTITVPDGFSVERVAGPPLVDRPIEADFDEQGRLYVTDSSGSNEKPEKQLEEKPHRIVRLEDTDGDGRYDKSIVFADKMMFPEGAMWHDGSLYVAAPPSIWKLTDTDNDGVADHREEWFQGKTLTGCANDLHGPYLGPDGWIYWTKGAFAKQTYERPGKPPFVTRAAHIFRSRADNSGIEPVMTGGMDNPVGLAFTPAGERIFSTTFFQRPEAGKRDGLIHAIYGGVYGKPNDATDDHKRTGDLMPVLTHLGPAAPAGLTRYRSDAFGKEYTDNLFTSLFNLHKVTRHVLTSTGATFRTDDSDFLVSDSNDFHPTDVFEDADGSLLVIDTGGWYKLCCPTSQLYKPDVLGAIYRVRRTGAPQTADPRGLKLQWSKSNPATLAKWLGDPRPAVQERATAELAKRGEKAISTLRSVLRRGPGSEASASRPDSSRQQLNAIWALTRMDASAAREAVRSVLRSSDESLQAAAIHSISVWRDAAALNDLLDCLAKSTSAHVKRAAAEALGRLGHPKATAALLAQAGSPLDRVLEHSITYALIEIGDRAGTAKALHSDNVSRRRTALMALDQMENGGLQAEVVTANLRSGSPALRQAAEWILTRRPEWAEAIVPFLRQSLEAAEVRDEEKDQRARLLKAFASRPPVQTLIGDIVARADAPQNSRLAALRSMAQSGLKELPAVWVSPLERVLTTGNGDLLSQAVAAARTVPLGKEGAGLAGGLIALARDAQHPSPVRLDALAALPSSSRLEDDAFQLAVEHLRPTAPVSTRSAALAVLSKARLTAEQFLALADRLNDLGPLEAPKVLALFSKANDDALGMKLVQNLKAAPALAALPSQTVLSCVTNFSPAVQESAAGLFAANARPTDGSRLEQLLSELPRGDVRRGQALFNSASTACSACHAIGYLGGNLGPDLTRIGQIRTERDLLEAILFPSASFVRSYEPVMVATRSGENFNGVLRKDAPDEVVLGTGPDVEVRIPRTDIAEMRPGTISVMPEGLDQQLSRQELADLLTFLKATRW